MKKYFLLFTMCFSLAFSAFAENAADPLNTFLQDLKSFKADFTQTLSNEQGEILETSSGIMYMQSPQKFRWVYKEPYSQLIITDGATLWVYDEDLEQVTIRDVSETIDDTPAAIISGQEDIDAHYVKTPMGKIEGADWIELTPRNTDSQYSSVRLGFDDGELAMMVLFDNLGQVTRIDFSNINRNRRYGGSLFTFTPPDGVDVIDDRQESAR